MRPGNGSITKLRVENTHYAHKDSRGILYFFCSETWPRTITQTYLCVDHAKVASVTKKKKIKYFCEGKPVFETIYFRISTVSRICKSYCNLYFSHQTVYAHVKCCVLPHTDRTKENQSEVFELQALDD